MKNLTARCDFEHFALLWKSAFLGKVESLLLDEIEYYHSFCKNPDTGLRFRQFYSQIEPLHVFLASKAKAKAYEVIAKQSIVSQHSSSIFIALKGTIDLAHGDVLKAQLNSLTPVQKRNILLLLVDYDPQSAFILSQKLKVQCIGLKVKGIPLKYRYFLILSSLKQSTCPNLRIIWWGIPFGMIFTFSALSLLDSSPYFRCKKISKEFIGVKHKFSWHRDYLDCIHAGFSCIEGFDNPPKVQIKYQQMTAYVESQLLPTSEFKSKCSDDKLYNLLVKAKNKGYIIITSASREEKTSDSRYLKSIENILLANNRILFLFFCRNSSNKFFLQEMSRLASINSKNIVLNAGWVNNIVDYISTIDLFLDPYPFGAGLTFVSSALQLKPCISVVDFVHSSPSAISAIKYFIKHENIQVNSEFLRKYLFLDTLEYSKAANDAIKKIRNKDPEISLYTNQLRSALKYIYFSKGKTLLSESY